MLKFLRIGVSALALSAFVVAPIMTVVTADYAYAKNGNGGGKGGDGGSKGGGGKGGDGGSKGGGGKAGGSKAGDGGGKSADKGHKGPGFGKAKGQQNRAASKAQKGLGRAIKDDFKSLSRNIKQNGIGGLFKQQKTKTVRSVSTKPTKTAPQKSTRPAVRASFKTDPMHPSNLGKMNGFLNSSINAKLAHIANGQYATNLNSPVSLGAAVAVAGYQLRTIQDTLAYSKALNDAQTTLQDLTEDDIQMAQKAVAGLTDDDIQMAQDIVDSKIEGDVDAARATLDAKAIADAQSTVDQAVKDRAVDPDTGEITESFAQEVTDANDALSTAELNLDEAEKNLLGIYKDQDYLADLTPKDQSDFLNKAIAQYGALPDDDAIAAALGENGASATEMGADGEGDDVSTDSTTEEEADSAMVEDIGTSEQG